MRLLRIISALSLLLFVSMEVKAQGLKDPTTWTYVAKRKFGNVFELHFQVKLAGNWHIYALKPGGDGTMIPPTFKIEPSKNIKLRGDMKEAAKPVEETVEEIGKIRYFKGEADFIQEVEVTGATEIKVTGSHEYQVCNDQICLPPKTKTFTFNIKP